MVSWIQLPIEIWFLIVREAMSVPWASSDFNHPPYDRTAISGYARASKTFRRIVRTVGNEKKVVALTEGKQVYLGEDLNRIK